MMGWRALAAVWAVLAVGSLGAAAALSALGPPAKTALVPGSSRPAPDDAGTPATHTSVEATAPAVPPPAPATVPPLATRPGTIAAPDQALLEPSPAGPDLQRPRVAADGRKSMTVYARPTDPADRRPRVAMLMVGFGLSTAESSLAMTVLPPAVTLGFSPYGIHPEALLSEARAQGHEYLVTLPMESQGYPLNQSGAHALLTGSDPAVNDANLQWVLSRMQGEVGLTGASDGLRGERFASAAIPFGVVIGELAHRGLLYVDPRPGARLTIPAGAAVVGTTMVVDDPTTRSDIDAKLAALEQLARDNGSAVGIAGPLRPVTVDRVAVMGTRAGRPRRRSGADQRPRSPADAMIAIGALPYRRNVGAALFNRRGQVFIARRADQAPDAVGAWQMPQGGIDDGEDPRLAVLRELREEIGTANAEIIGEHPDWLDYDLPPELLGVALGGRFRGQRQRWFALRFHGEDADIRLDEDPHPEFDRWRWAALTDIADLTVPFRQPIYRILARSFHGYTGAPA